MTCYQYHYWNKIPGFLYELIPSPGSACICSLSVCLFHLHRRTAEDRVGVGEQLHLQNVPFSVCQPQQFNFLHCLFFGEVSPSIKAWGDAQLTPFPTFITDGSERVIMSVWLLNQLKWIIWKNTRLFKMRTVWIKYCWKKKTMQQMSCSFSLDSLCSI